MQSRSISPNDSLVSESVNTNSAFRVSVCLQRYFKDVRSRCYILVSRNRPVRWLEQRILKIFALSGKFCLSTNGHMLPSCEPLALLNTDDTIDVIPLTDLGVEIINSTVDCNMYRYNAETSSSVLESSSKECTRIDILKINCPGALDNAASETNEIINENHIDGTLPTEQPNHVSTSHNLNVYDDTTQSLSNMKRKALAMLDCTTSSDKDDKKIEENFPDPPRRTRHRVRRRRRRHAEPVQDTGDQDTQEETHLVEPIQINKASSDDKPLETSQIVQIRTTMQQVDASATVCSVFETEPHIISSSPLPEVARNETLYPRKARIVHSLDE